MADNLLSHLHPDLQPFCMQLLTACKNKGISIKITETWRDPDRENQLHAQGITAATGDTCKHCFMIDDKPASKAFDFALFDSAGKYITNGTDSLYAQAGELGESIGLVWGGRWHHPDYDHFQLKE